MSRSQGLGRLHSQGIGLQFLCRGRRLQDLDLRPWPATSNQRAEPLVLRMGAALPCLRGDRPPRHPPPMARPPPPRLNVEAQPSHPLPNEYEWARIPNFPFNYGKAPAPPAPLYDATFWRRCLGHPWPPPPGHPWPPPHAGDPPPAKAPPPLIVVPL